MLTKTAYTTVDLVVTMVCLGILILTLGAAGFTGREMAKRTVCVANIHQNIEAMFAYANDSDGEFPRRFLGQWLIDLNRYVRDPLMDQYGLQREMLYCPSNDIQQKYMNLYFLFSDSFSVTGYCYLVESISPNSPSAAEIGGPGNKQWVSSINDENASSAELVVDTTFSIPRPTERTGWDFRQVPGGIFAQFTIFDSSNHLKTEAEPWGANIGFLDGHVTWRPFNVMEPRLSYGPLTWWW